MTTYSKEDDYTLCAYNALPGAGVLRRYFNFASEQITTIYSEKAQIEMKIKDYERNGGNSAAVSVALTSQMDIRKFSELDSQLEIELMRKKLRDLGGTPPEENAGTSGKIRPGLRPA